MNKTLEEQLQELATPVQEVIKEAFEKKMAEAKELAYEQARVELSEKYKADIEALTLGAEALIKESIEEKTKELAEAKAEAEAAKAKIEESVTKSQKLIVEALAKEVHNIREEKAKMDEKLSEVDAFVKANLVEHVQALEEERQKYIKSSAKVIEEGIELQENAKHDFIKVATDKVADVVFENMSESIEALKAEIKEAQQNEFGKRLFEMFSGEFKALFLNENKEIQKERSEKAKLAEAVKKAKTILETKNSQISSLKEKVEEQKELRKRDSIIAEASKGLSETKREVLKKMVESVSTDKLETVISEYIPAVLGNTNAKKFTESASKATPKLTIKTGDKVAVVNESVAKEPARKDMINEEIDNIGLDVEYMDRMLGL